MSDHETPLDDPAFNAWCDELDAYAVSLDIKVQVSHTHDTGREAWLVYYEGELTPREALEEDFSNA